MKWVSYTWGFFNHYIKQKTADKKVERLSHTLFILSEHVRWDNVTNTIQHTFQMTLRNLLLRRLPSKALSLSFFIMSGLLNRFSHSVLQVTNKQTFKAGVETQQWIILKFISIFWALSTYTGRLYIHTLILRSKFWDMINNKFLFFFMKQSFATCCSHQVKSIIAQTKAAFHKLKNILCNLSLLNEVRNSKCTRETINQ